MLLIHYEGPFHNSSLSSAKESNNTVLGTSKRPCCSIVDTKECEMAQRDGALSAFAVTLRGRVTAKVQAWPFLFVKYCFTAVFISNHYVVNTNKNCIYFILVYGVLFTWSLLLLSNYFFSFLQENVKKRTCPGDVNLGLSTANSIEQNRVCIHKTILGKKYTREDISADLNAAYIF